MKKIQNFIGAHAMAIVILTQEQNIKQHFEQ